MMRPAGRTGSARASVSRSQAGVPDARPTRGGRAPVQWRTASTTATTRVARRTTTVARRIDPAQLPRGVVTGERAPGSRDDGTLHASAACCDAARGWSTSWRNSAAGRRGRPRSAYEAPHETRDRDSSATRRRIEAERAPPPPRTAVPPRASVRQSRRPRARVPPHRRPQRLQRDHAHLRERGQGIVARPVVVGEVGRAEAEEARLEAEARRVGEEVEEVAGEEPAAELPHLVAPHLGTVAGHRHLVEERREVDAA